jgi:ribosome-associated heat shock protein Hsp15
MMRSVIRTNTEHHSNGDTKRGQPHMQGVRIDKWLWAARFYKTRSLASDEVRADRVQVNGQGIKPAREVRIGDTVVLRQAGMARTVVVLALSAIRGPAPVAQLLYAETPASVTAREAAAAQRRMQPEPALARESGRPTKRDRRALQSHDRSVMDDRWTASLPEAGPRHR